jgi:FkbM family methyltransferase
MLLTRLAEHTVDLRRLPVAPVVLDAGSRGFDFTNEILRLRPKANVFAIEADPDLVEEIPAGVTLIKAALVGTKQKPLENYYVSSRGGFSNSLVFLPAGVEATKKVPVITIADIMAQYGIFKWDLVKLDIEGSEFDVLERWPGPVADQITVEFHDYFDDHNRWGDAWFNNLLAGPLSAYTAVKNDKYPIDDLHFGHWDSLFTLN